MNRASRVHLHATFDDLLLADGGNCGTIDLSVCCFLTPPAPAPPHPACSSVQQHGPRSSYWPQFSKGSFRGCVDDVGGRRIY